MEIGGMLFDVRLDGHEILVDEGRGLIIGIGFGFQPNACASSRGGTEINQQWFLFRLRFCQRRVCVFVPFDSHFC
jgi:hypothetical protein